MQPHSHYWKISPPFPIYPVLVGFGLFEVKKYAVLHTPPLNLSSPAGLTSLIETQQTVMAAVGEEAQLNCQLMQSKDVLQVTWQKLLPEGEKNLATYSNKFGQTVNPDFRNNVEFKCAGLQNSSIVIRKVTEQDEGCYLCLFNTYPEGALTATTCLLLYGKNLTVLSETFTWSFM